MTYATTLVQTTPTKRIVTKTKLALELDETRHALYIATLTGAFEVTAILTVESIYMHIMFALALFGKDIAHEVRSADKL